MFIPTTILSSPLPLSSLTSLSFPEKHTKYSTLQGLPVHRLCALPLTVYACLTSHPDFSLNVTEGYAGTLASKSPPPHYSTFSEHPSQCVSVGPLAECPSPGECTFHDSKEHTCLDPYQRAQWPPHIVPSTKQGPGIHGGPSVLLSPPSRSVETTQSSWPACGLQQQTPEPKILSCFHSPPSLS